MENGCNACAEVIRCVVLVLAVNVRKRANCNCNSKVKLLKRGFQGSLSAKKVVSKRKEVHQNGSANLWSSRCGDPYQMRLQLQQ